MNGTWIISWPATDTDPSEVWLIPAESWTPSSQAQIDIREAGGTIRFIPSPEGYEKKPATVPKVKVGGEDRDTKSIESRRAETTPSGGTGEGRYAPGAAWYDASGEVLWVWAGDDAEEITIEEDYIYNVDGQEKTVSVNFTYQHINVSTTIGGGGVLYINDDSGMYKVSISGDYISAMPFSGIVFGGHDGFAYFTAGVNFYRIVSDEAQLIPNITTADGDLIGVDRYGYIYLRVMSGAPNPSKAIKKYTNTGGLITSIDIYSLYGSSFIHPPGGMIDGEGNIYYFYSDQLVKLQMDGTEIFNIEVESGAIYPTVDIDGNITYSASPNLIFLTYEGVKSWELPVHYSNGTTGNGIFFIKEEVVE